MERARTTTRVLLVEDSPDDAELVLLELEQAGLEVESRRVERADDLRSALADGDWDIIISDFAMPGFNGLEAFLIVESMGTDVPFLFVSGALGEERAVEAMRAGARDYLLKSNLKRLGQAVRRELREGASRRERRRTEELARQEARRLTAAVEASGAGIYEHRVPPGDDSYHSDRWAEILGFRAAELPPPREVPGWFERRIHPEDRRAVAGAHADFLAGRQPTLEIETRVSHRDGGWVSVALFCKPIERDPRGRVTKIVGVMLDLTQRRRLEDQLRQAQKMEAVGRLAGGIAHDFNNLLTVIYSFGGFALQALPGDSPAGSDIHEVLKAAERAAGLTAQLLAFSRRQTIEPRLLNLNDLVGGVEKMLRRVLGEDIDFTTRLAPDLGTVRVDRSAFEQVLVNLAINARDAMPEGGQLLIETFNSDVLAGSSSSVAAELTHRGYVGVAVTDSGVGMDAETLAQAFEPFFTTKELGKGTGLGLSTCYGIIKQAGGTIRISSELGAGTTVRVLLPRSLELAEPVEARPAPATFDGTETVLVAEDDAQVRRLCVRVLSQRGYRVLEAEHGEQALEVCRGTSAPIHLLLTDVVMPIMGGKQLAAKLRALRPETEVLFMSGYAAGAVGAPSGDLPEERVLVKPFTPEVLLRAVRSRLDRRQGN